MNLSIEGKFKKVEDGWEASIPVLNLTVKEINLLGCLRSICQQLKTQLGGQALVCSIRVADGDLFYLQLSKESPHAE